MGSADEVMIQATELNRTMRVRSAPKPTFMMQQQCHWIL